MRLLALLLVVGILLPNPAAASCADGPVVQAVYAHSGNITERKAEIRGALRDADALINDAAARKGEQRHVRYARNSRCNISIKTVQVTRAAKRDFVTLQQEISYLRDDNVKHIVFVEALSDACGRATTLPDESPEQTNANNGWSVAAVYRDCINARTVAHELMHAFGAVQHGAAGSDGAHHHVGRWDLMGGGRVLDRGLDDYFDPRPTSGEYLDTHWNTANSKFLVR